MKNFEQKIHIKNKTEFPDKDIVAGTKIAHTSTFDEIKSESVDIEKILGKESEQKLIYLYRIIHKKFAERGIPTAQLFPVLFKIQKVEEIGIAGRSYPDCVEIFDLNIEDEKLKQLIVFKTIAHELYHCTGRISLEFTPGNEGTGDLLSMKELSTGASFTPKNFTLHEEELYLRAFEEGAASQFETEIFQEIKKLFSEDTVKSYDTIAEHAAGRLQNDDSFAKNISPDQIRITESKKNGDYKFSPDAYFESRQLVEYLASEIPNFYTLLEDARVNGKIIPLGKAIDTRFGAGSYRRIAVAVTTESVSLLEELKKELNNP